MALRVYYEHWGNDEIKARRQQQGIQQLYSKLQRIGLDTAEGLIDLFDGAWVDKDEAVSIWKEISTSMLNECVYTRKTWRCRIAKSLNLPSPKLIYKLGIGPEMLRGIDAIVALR